MYQAYLSELAQAHCSENPTKTHHGVRQRFAADLANLFRMVLDDKSDAPYVAVAQKTVAADFQLYTHQLTELGSAESQRLFSQHKAAIRGLCKPNFVDPYWLVALNDLDIPELVTHLAEHCQLRTVYDSGLFEDLESLPVGPRRKLARVGMSEINQGYTLNFLEFAAGVALETGVTGTQFKRYLAVGMNKDRNHFARALIKAIAVQHEGLKPTQVKYAVDTVWKFTRSLNSPKDFEPAFKAELTSFFRELDVPVSVFAHSSAEKDRLLGQDLGL